jgi:hypothetical protein
MFGGEWRSILSLQDIVGLKRCLWHDYLFIADFVFVLCLGVFMVASASQIWRATGGKLNSDIFKYKIGGEW